MTINENNYQCKVTRLKENTLIYMFICNPLAGTPGKDVNIIRKKKSVKSNKIIVIIILNN